MRIAIIFLAALISSACHERKSNNSWSIISPDGRLTANLVHDPDSGKIFFDVHLTNGKQMIHLVNRSPLGMVRDDTDFSKGLKVVSVDSMETIDNEYEILSGKRKLNRDFYRRRIFHFAASGGDIMNVEFRAYNDGTAFRYSFTKSDDASHIMIKEATGFNIPSGNAWIQPYDTISKWTPAYEKYYEDGIKTGSPSPNKNGWCFPALFKVDGAWLLLSESDVTTQNVGSHLQNAGGTMYTIVGPDSLEAEGLEDTYARTHLPWKSAWRIMIASPSLGSIVESNLVMHTSAPPDSTIDFHWVIPGAASWSWWSDQRSPRDFQALKKYIDFAASMGWPYSLVDANWNEMHGGNIDQLASYAAKKNVGLWLWYNSGGPNNTVEEMPRDIMFDSNARRNEMKRLSSLGVKGVKIDFFQSDKQFIIKEYLDILKDAAEFKIMVNFHGCTIPRGWSRTWPNLIGMESVRGAESYLFASEFPPLAPMHNVKLIFTRNVVGPMDYTVATLSDNRFSHQTTLGHELALPVMFECGITHFADSYSSYNALDARIRKIFMNFPTTWLETTFIAGDPAHYAVIARKSENRWYVAGINGESVQQKLQLNLPFLKESAAWKVEMIVDDGAARKLKVGNDQFFSDSKPSVSMIPYGGFLWVLTPIEHS
jgi:hypothetical protein